MKMPFLVLGYQITEYGTRLFVGIPRTHELVNPNTTKLQDLLIHSKIRVLEITRKLDIRDRKTAELLNWLVWFELVTVQHRENTITSEQDLYRQARRRLTDTVKQLKRKIAPDDMVPETMLLEFARDDRAQGHPQVDLREKRDGVQQ